jgi:hypothetical protein
MRNRIAIVISIALVSAAPVHATIVWNESVNGDLSNDAAAPTPMVFSVGANTIQGTVINIDDRARDYVSFTVQPGHVLTAINLLEYSADDIGFVAINDGLTSYIPDYSTEAYFKGGAHIVEPDVGSNLLDLFVTRSVTSNSLTSPELGPGDYSFLLQQTDPVVTSYALEFVVSAPLKTENATWGSIKALYR